jgi:murein DD-endopeptidase MepM/ murein hydrolase activator NlpD
MTRFIAIVLGLFVALTACESAPLAEVRITANPLDLSIVTAISTFRSCAGHDYSGRNTDGEVESERSMKHYVHTTIPWTGGRSTSGYAPFDGRIVAIEEEVFPLGRQVRIASATAPEWHFIFFHAEPLVKVGQSVKAGQSVVRFPPADMKGVPLERLPPRVAFDIALRNGNTCASPFLFMDDSVLAAYARKGFTPANLIITKAERDSDPCAEYNAHPERDFVDASDSRVEDALPELRSFRAHPSDRFLVNLDDISWGHPYKGKRAASPHTGAHVHWDNREGLFPRGGSDPSNYPPIYAVADGVVDRITKSLRVGENDRYGVNIAIGRTGDTVWDFEYSIEPMVPEPSPGFYLSFLRVREGDRVRKGQVIGYMYLPRDANGSHIHFELITSGIPRMAVPAIFTPEVVDAFAARWDNGGKDGDRAIPACMGWMLTSEENPFDGKAVDCLK